ncbi:alpha/beta fold hydrolase [Deinococcus hohokamensis]|uniref:Alpha/beta fold hydrolase n=1 Tax=Deinococcus hohokamensis TaxID=309883 RepID=A0ABV9IA60_9DEIO
MLLSSAWAGGAGAPAQTGTVRWVPCPAEVRATRCGYVRVPMNHARPGGRSLEIFVALQRALSSAARQPDPVFYLAGGPGGRGTPAVWSLAKAFRNRDVLSMDPRGVGPSRPELTCYGANSPRALAVCAQGWRAQGLNPEDFGSAQAALDADMVRRALGYGPVNLYGVSYGSRLAQEVLRRAPGAVRSVVMAGVLPASLPDTAPPAMPVALQRVLAACEADADCWKAHPDLPARYERLLAQADAVALLRMAQTLDQYLRHDLAAGQIPAVIEAFDGRGTAGAVRFPAPADGEAGFNSAIQILVSCLGRGPGGPDDVHRAQCEAMRLRPAPQEHEAVRSNVPALLIGGEFDPATLPDWMPLVARSLPHSLSVVLRGWGHGAGWSPCGLWLAQQLIDRPQAALDTSCAPLGRLVFAPLPVR